MVTLGYGPVRFDTTVHLWFGRLILRTPSVPRAGPVRASYGPRTEIINVFHILRDPYGARAGPARVPYGSLADTQGNWHNQNWQNSRTGVVFGRTMPVRAPHGNHQCFSYPTGPVRGRAGPARVPYGSLADTQGNWHNQNWQNSRTGVVFGRTGPLRAPQGLFTGCLQYLNLYGARKLIMHALKLYGPHTGRQNSYGAARGRAGPVSGRTIFVQNSPGTARTGPGSVMWLRHKSAHRIKESK